MAPAIGASAKMSPDPPDHRASMGVRRTNSDVATNMETITRVSSSVVRRRQTRLVALALLRLPRKDEMGCSPASMAIAVEKDFK